MNIIIHVSYKHHQNMICQKKNVLITLIQIVPNMIGMYKIGLKHIKKCFLNWYKKNHNDIKKSIIISNIIKPTMF